ncbi:hypothetical protein BLNAU_2397 [Blattamonas nauphoetae]|uniref:PH domain-containing protein n=1 Tax=Blattamonas nauphoetae TaxID=2049346 RepID=A0ABQ9YFR5_9EUKA|nr:hypothetical protein BLNAU_2397 [Blattamonas nauphoetae]
MISAPSFPYLPSATQKLSVPDHQLSSPISSSLTTNKPLKVDHLHETSKDSCDDTSSINSLYDDLTCSPCFIDAEPPSEQPISPPLIHTDTVQALSQSTPPQQVQEPPLTMEEHTISLVKQELLPSDVVVLEGFLSFRGQIVPQFRSRYALLTQNRLLYFPLNEPISSKLVRCIDLTDASVLSGSDGQSVNIVLSTPHSVHNIYRIKAENGAIAAKWTNALSSLLSPPEAS